MYKSTKDKSDKGLMVENETKQVRFIVISDQRFVQWECSIVDTMYSRQRQGVRSALVKVVALGLRSGCVAVGVSQTILRCKAEQK